MANSPPATQKKACITDLPPELRERVYSFALGGRILHISEELYLTGACYIRGSRAKNDARRIREIRAARSEPDAATPGFYLEHHDGCIDTPNFSLLPASRTTYREVKPILYGKNIFQFSSILAFYKFIRRSSSDILGQIRYITILVSIDPRTEGFEESLFNFLIRGPCYDGLKKKLSKLKEVKALQLLMETRTSRIGYPNLNTAQLLGEMSNRLRGKTPTACMYHPVRRSFDARLSEDAMMYFEDLATGGNGGLYGRSDEWSGGKVHSIDEDRQSDWDGAYTGESSDDDERWDGAYLDNMGGDVSEDLGDVTDDSGNDSEEEDDNSEEEGDDSEEDGDSGEDDGDSGEDNDDNSEDGGDDAEEADG